MYGVARRAPPPSEAVRPAEYPWSSTSSSAPSMEKLVRL
jgi:hypothetical protein